MLRDVDGLLVGEPFEMRARMQRPRDATVGLIRDLAGLDREFLSVRVPLPHECEAVLLGFDETFSAELDDVGGGGA